MGIEYPPHIGLRGLTEDGLRSFDLSFTVPFNETKHIAVLSNIPLSGSSDTKPEAVVCMVEHGHHLGKDVHPENPRPIQLRVSDLQ